MTTPPTRPRRSSGRLRRAIGLAVTPALLFSGALVLTTPEQANAADQVPDTAALAGELADQELTWETCDFGNDAYNERFNLPNVDCATVQVPQDWHNPDNGKTWDIRISQAKNVEPGDADYKGTILVNPGGPGGEGLVWGPAMQEMTPDLQPHYNYVGFDPRGVGQSSHAECTYTWDPASEDPYAELKAAGAACSADEDVRTINTEQTAYDMDFIRHLLGAPKLSYIGYSYGTWLGAWYEKVFGAEYGDKFLLDSSIDATDRTLEKTWDLQPIARDRQFEMHLMNWMARHDSTYGLGTDPAAIHERYLGATEQLDEFTIMVLWILTGAYGAFPNNADYPLAADVVQVLIELGEADEAAPASDNPAVAAAEMLDRAAEASDGDTRAVFQQARKQIAPLTDVAPKQQAAEPAATETATLDSVFDFVLCNDGQWTQGASYWEKRNAKLAEKAPLSDSWGLLSVPLCAFWPTDNEMPKAHPKTFPNTVVVQGEMDSQTGWEGGHRAGTKLPNTSLIAVDNEGSHGLFPYGVAEVDDPIVSYFLTGRQPRPTSVVDAKPLPTEDTTYETWRVIGPRANHIGPVITDPTVPADAPRGGRPHVASAGSTTGLRDLVADQASSTMLRNQVQRVYGEDGVKALERAGLI